MFFLTNRSGSIRQLILAVFLYLFIGCNKDKNTDCWLTSYADAFTYSLFSRFNVTTDSGKIKTITISNLIINLFYNAEGKLIRQEESSVNLLNIVSKSFYTYDASGKLTEFKRYNFQPDTVLWRAITYQYDGNHISQINFYDSVNYKGKQVFQWTDDNISQSESYNENNIFVARFTYRYPEAKGDSKFNSRFKEFYYLNQIYNLEDFTSALFLSKGQLTYVSVDTLYYNQDLRYIYNDKQLPLFIISSSDTIYRFTYSCD